MISIGRAVLQSTRAVPQGTHLRARDTIAWNLRIFVKLCPLLATAVLQSTPKNKQRVRRRRLGQEPQIGSVMQAPTWLKSNKSKNGNGSGLKKDGMICQKTFQMISKKIIAKATANHDIDNFG